VIATRLVLALVVVLVCTARAIFSVQTGNDRIVVGSRSDTDRARRSCGARHCAAIYRLTPVGSLRAGFVLCFRERFNTFAHSLAEAHSNLRACYGVLRVPVCIARAAASAPRNCSHLSGGGDFENCNTALYGVLSISLGMKLTGGEEMECRLRN
jgi:hypothetical protein